MKAAIFKNMKLQAAESDADSPRNMYDRERSNSFGPETHERKDKSPDNIEDISHENAEVHKNIEKMIRRTPDKHPSKLITPGKKYSSFDQRSAGNSPKLSGDGGIPSKYKEETKSPK